KVEKFANAFASYLLVPHLELKYKLDEFKGKQKLSDADIICLADFFEVSKSMITYRLDRLNISYDLGSGNLSTDIDLKIKLQYVKGVFSNSKKLFDSYRKVNIMEIVSNDSRFEGINLEIEEISEIIFDIEGFLDEGKILSKNEIEIIGLYYMYEKLLEENDIPDQYKLQDYHSYLYKLSKEYVKGFRQSGNYITGAKFHTPPPTKVQEEMYLLANDIRFIFDESFREVNLEFINSLAMIHQKITWIH
ncbi:hypothetical protein EHR31_11575, partial [Staphylococcus pseudintermedius]|nr:hypothetical protein [Staphylococcus pseudintermedius]